MNTIGNLPIKVEILGVSYSIIYDSDLWEKEKCWGVIEYKKQTIKIWRNEDFSLEDYWNIIIHEVIHGISTALDLELESTDEGEKRLNRLAQGLTKVLLSNNWINPNLIEKGDKL